MGLFYVTELLHSARVRTLCHRQCVRMVKSKQRVCCILYGLFERLYCGTIND